MKRILVGLVCSGVLVLGSAGSASAGSVGSISWLRSAAATVIGAELDGDGAVACGKLYAPLATTVDGRTCAERWDARSSRLLAVAGGAGRLRADLRALPGAAVTMSGLYASIALPHPLLGGQSRFYWTDDCWMLTR